MHDLKLREGRKYLGETQTGSSLTHLVQEGGK